MPSELPNTRLYTITYGGWYQRTTLHLSELYEFFANANSYLALDLAKVKAFHDDLELVSTVRELGYLEFVEIKTKNDITIRYYEDGLYILNHTSNDVPNSRQILEKFFDEKLSPAVSYIFSLGAPTPKILANMQISHPIAVTYEYENELDTNLYPVDWLTEIYSTLEAPGVRVVKAKKYIFVQVKKSIGIAAGDIVELQIFFREFKDQLEKYLNIHRKIWEEITTIKEKRNIKTKDLAEIRAKVDSYAKTISLISNRINQMASYVKTRKSIAQQAGIDTHLVALFQYRFEVLLDTLDYIKEIWKMTSDYVNSAIQVIVEAQSAATARGIQSLTLITSIGVIAGLIAHLSREAFPKVTTVGSLYFLLLLCIGWVMNLLIQKISLSRKQTLTFKEFDKKL